MDVPRGSSVIIRPMGVGEVVDTGLRLARQNYRALVTLAAWVYVPLLVLSGIIDVLFLPSVPTTGASVFTFRPAFALASFIGGIIGGLAVLLVTLALIAACSRLVETSPALDLRSILAPGALLRLAFGHLGTAVLMGIVLAFAALTIFIPPLFIFLFVRWSVAFVALVAERLGPLASLGRSWGLTRGSWWHTFGVLIVIAILEIALEAAVGVVGLVISGVLTTVAGNPVAGTIVTSVFSTLFSILIVPLTTAILVVLYYELRARREGFDLAMRAEQGPATG